MAYQRLNQKYDGKICSKCGFLEIIKNEEAFKPDDKNKKFKLKTKIYERQTFLESERIAIDDATHPRRPPPPPPRTPTKKKQKAENFVTAAIVKQYAIAPKNAKKQIGRITNRYVNK